MQPATPRLALEAYYAMAPAEQVIQHFKAACEVAGRDWLSAEAQAEFFASVVDDAWSRRFPPTLAFRRRVLRCFLDAVEASRSDVDESLLDEYMAILHAPPPKQEGELREACHRLYLIKEDSRPLVLRVANQLDSVGLSIWDAGKVLANYMIRHVELCRGKHVLELGSGVGVTGLALAIATAPASLSMTDYAQPVLDNLRHNVILNDLDGVVSASALDWFNPEPGLALLSPKIDVVIAADCVYDIELIDNFVLVLKTLLSTPGRVAYISSTLRNPNTYQHYLTLLTKHDLVYENTQIFPESTFSRPLTVTPMAEVYLTVIRSACD